MAAFTVQYVSDLHLEFRSKRKSRLTDLPFTPINGCPYLALCGDIGDPFQQSYSQLLKDVSPHCRRVFVITGNHEYYGHSMAQTHEKIHSICAELPNITFLNNNSYETDDAVFYGTTLWSNIDDNIPLNDFNKILVNDRLLTAQDVRAMHAGAVASITEFMSDYTGDKPVILLTHHAPMESMTGPYAGKWNNSAFFTNLPQLFQDPVRAIICGHTHVCTRTVLNSVPCVSNCAGYDDEGPPNGFSKTAEIGGFSRVV